MGETRPDTVWIVGAGALQVPLMAQAHELGLLVIASDRNPEAPGAQLADHFAQLDTQDVEAHRTLARAMRRQDVWCVRGCCTAGADVAPSVAAVAEVLGTPGIPFTVAQTTHNKYTVRLRLEAAGLQRVQPDYCWLDLEQPSERPEDLGRRLHGWPLVLKPLEQCASRGVTLVSGPEAFPAAIHAARAYGPRALVEEGLRGSEHSVEGIFDGEGAVVFFNIVDRVFSYAGGIPLELGHTNPSRLSKVEQLGMQRVWEEAAAALGVAWGPFKCDMMQTARGPKILECTARLSGGWDCQATTPLASGWRPMQTVLELACGRPVSRDALEGWAVSQHAACMAILPPAGRVVAMHVPSWPALQAMGVAQLILTVQPGDVIPPYTHCATRPGFVISVHPEPGVAFIQASAAAEALAAAFEIEPA